MAGDEQEEDLRDQLFVGQDVAALLGLDEVRQDAVVGVLALPGDDLGDESGQVVAGHLDRPQELGVQHGLEAADHDTGPVADLVAVGVGEAEHLGDDVEGQREGELAHQLHRAGVGRPVELLVDELLHPVAPLGDAPRGERPGHQAAEAGVVGRVTVEHRLEPVAVAVLAEHLVDVGRHRRRLGVAVLDAQRGVPQEAQDVVVAGDVPGAERGLVRPDRAPAAPAAGRTDPRRSRARTG